MELTFFKKFDIKSGSNPVTSSNADIEPIT